jgi:carbonic anhydrase
LTNEFEEIEDLLIEGNKKYQWKIVQEEETPKIDGPIPKYPVLILTCMDSRIDVHRIFQLKPGDVFVLRNAGNLYTEDVLRSVLIAIHEYNIKYILILGHVDCCLKKIRLGELKDKLNDSAIKKIVRYRTNFYLELQKFFKTFNDEIQNIENQLQKFRYAKELPTYIKIKGMLYAPYSGWVFEEKVFRKYSVYENFAKDYRKILKAKQFELIDYLEKIEDEIISGDVLKKLEEPEIIDEHGEVPQIEVEMNDQESFNFNVDALEERNSKTSSFDDPNFDFEQFQNKSIPMPKLQIPKIYIHIPKIKVYVPVLYKKQSLKSE